MSCGEDTLGDTSIQGWPALDRDRTPEECFLDPKITRLALDTADAFVARLVAAASEVVNCSVIVSARVQTRRSDMLTLGSAL